MKNFKEIRGTLKEAEHGKLPDPPPVIMLRRIGLRNFPTGERVALYRNDKLGLDVSVPYFPGKFGKTQISMGSLKEEIELTLNETIIKKLIRIAGGSKPDNVSLGNGVQIPVQPNVAKKLIDLTKKVNFTNRVNLSRFMSGNPNDLKKIVDFTTNNPV
jgi:hypothetical protein